MPISQRQQQLRTEQLQNQQRAEADSRRVALARTLVSAPDFVRENVAIQNLVAPEVEIRLVNPVTIWDRPTGYSSRFVGGTDPAAQSGEHTVANFLTSHSSSGYTITGGARLQEELDAVLTQQLQRDTDRRVAGIIARPTTLDQAYITWPTSVAYKPLLERDNARELVAAQAQEQELAAAEEWLRNSPWG